MRCFPEWLQVCSASSTVLVIHHSSQAWHIQRSLHFDIFPATATTAQSWLLLIQRFRLTLPTHSVCTTWGWSYSWISGGFVQLLITQLLQLMCNHNEVPVFVIDQHMCGATEIFMKWAYHEELHALELVTNPDGTTALAPNTFLQVSPNFRQCTYIHVAFAQLACSLC